MLRFHHEDEDDSSASAAGLFDEAANGDAKKAANGESVMEMVRSSGCFHGLRTLLQP